MDSTRATHSHRTFARTNGAVGAAVPHLVAAEERHRKNLQQIRQLKVALCSTVSSAAPPQLSSPTPRGESLPSSSSPSLPSQALPAWSAPRSHSTGVVASPATSAVPVAPAPQPPPARETPVSAAVLQSSQQEVEQLVREKHRLQRQCIELASLLASASQGGTSSALTVVASASQESSSWSTVHDAALAVVEQVTRCYPNVVQGWAIAKSGREDAAVSVRATESSQDAATPSLSAAAARGCHTNTRYENSVFADTTDITADKLAGALRSLAEFLPQLASMAAVSEFLAEAGPEMLDHIHTLEEEKRSDCLAVLSITDHLTKVSVQLQREAMEKDATLHALQQTVSDLMEEKQEWSRRARASEAALAERYTQYRQREKAWEEEVAQLLQVKESVSVPTAAPATAPAVEDVTAGREEPSAETDEKRAGQLTHLQELLKEREAAFELLQQEYNALKSAHAAVQASSQETEAAQQERITVLERQLHPLESELQAQSDTIRATVQKVEELTAAHRAEVAALHESHNAALQAKEDALNGLQAEKARIEMELADVTATVALRTAELQAVTAARDEVQAALNEQNQRAAADSSSLLVTASTPIRLVQPEVGSADVCESQDNFAEEDEATESASRLGEGGDDTSDSVDTSISRCTNVRKLQQSLKRMSRERAALKRKLEHRGAALAEMEAELEATQRVVAQHEARIQVLHADAARVGASAAQNSAAVSDSTKTASIIPICWITFAELEQHEKEGTLYPAPVDLSGWLLDHTEPLRFADYVARHLSHHDQLLIDAVGPLYHVGFNLLKAEGLLDDCFYFPVIWRRFLLQLQQVLDAQLSSGLLVSPADSARCFYTLASTAGLLKGKHDAHNSLEVYTLILASLCVCLSSRDTAAIASTHSPQPTAQLDHLPGSLSSTQDQRGSKQDFSTGKWRCCQAILQHVCGQGDGESDATRQRHAFLAEDSGASPFSLLMLITQQNPAAVLLRASDSDVSLAREVSSRGSRSDGVAATEAAAVPALTVASLLSQGLLSDALPLTRLSLQAVILRQAAQRKAEVGEWRTGTVPETERGLFSPASAPPPALSQQSVLVSLLLYIARHECLLGGWRSWSVPSMKEEAEEDDAAPPLLSLESLGLHRSFSAAPAARDDAHSQTEVEDTAEVLLLLDTELLPAIVMSISMCRPLEQHPRLLLAYFETRRALIDQQTVLLLEAQTSPSSPPPPQQQQLLPGVPLPSEAQLRVCIQQLLAPIPCPSPVRNRVVQVPAAEYERLQRELLTLYQTNETYDAYIQELIGTVEAL
jgi:hypothetical protein